MKAVNLKGHILYDSKYMAFWKRQNYKDSKINGVQGLGVYAWIGGAQSIFRAVEIPREVEKESGLEIFQVSRANSSF